MFNLIVSVPSLKLSFSLFFELLINSDITYWLLSSIQSVVLYFIVLDTDFLLFVELKDYTEELEDMLLIESEGLLFLDVTLSLVDDILMLLLSF